MSLPTSYMSGNYTKIPQYFEAILNAQAPEKFTVKFLKDLGFTSSTDIQFISVLKTLGFLDDSGSPTDSYFSLFDRAQSKILIANGIRLAYGDLFALNTNAQLLSRDEVKSKFKVLTSGQKSDSTLNQMASTYVQLCAYADWTKTITQTNSAQEKVHKNKEEVILPNILSNQSPQQNEKKIDFNYDIHIHLPVTRDERVYDALFASLTKYIALK